MKSLLLVVSLFIALLVNAQNTPPWLWARAYGNGYGTGENGVIVNADGTEFTSGYYYDDGIDVAYEFVAKADSNGAVIWSKSITVPSMFPGSTIAVDGNYNVYIASGFMGSYIVVGQDTVKAKNAFNNFYVAKFDSSGNFQWANCPATASGGNYGDFVSSMSGDATGNLWITGGFADSITFGTTLLTTTGKQNIFVVKFNSAGNVVMGKAFGGADQDYANAITTDPAGNAYITGVYQSPSITFGSNTITNAGTQNIFTFKCSPSGTVLWANTAGGSAYDDAEAISLDSRQNVYITGYLASASAAFGNDTVKDTSGNAQAFTAKYNASGNLVWVKSVTGSATGGDIGGTGLSNDKNGNVYVAGSFQCAYVIIGNDTLVNADPSLTTSDIFLVKYDSSGNDLWALRLGGTLSDIPNAISNNANGNIYMTGTWYSGTLAFTDTTLVDQQQYSGEYSMGFLAKLAANPCSYNLSYDTLQASDTGGIYGLYINTQTACGWSGEITTGYNWLRLSRTSGIGADSANITVASNNADTMRVGTIVINGKTITIIQPGNPASCYYQLSTNTFSCPSSVANIYYYISNVTTQTGCTWSALVVTGSEWLSTISGGTGNGSITIAVQANQSATSRIGAIYVNGQILTIAQPGDSSTCTYILSTNFFNCTSAIANSYYDIANVSASDTCSWTAIVTSGGDWLSTSSSGYGNGEISITAGQNTTDSSRFGTISLNGQTITVYQPDGANNCIYALTQSAFVCPTPGAATYDSICDVQTTDGCNWVATVTAGSAWLSSTSGASGNGDISVSVSDNTSGALRIGTVTVNGHTLSIVQVAEAEGIANISAPIIAVYPNPSTGQFYFKGITSGSTLEVYDVLGQNVFSTTISPSGGGKGQETYLLNISSQAKGVYFYRVVNNGNAVQDGKIILE